MIQMENSAQAISSDQQSLKQILALAQFLGNGGQECSDTEVPADMQSGAFAPDGMALLSAFFGSGLDPGIQRLLAVLRDGDDSGDEVTALLLALRPFVGEERQALLDEALHLAKLLRIARLLLQIIKGGDEDV